MNPVLLKPGSDGRSQVVVLGSPVGGGRRASSYARAQAERLLHVVADAWPSSARDTTW